MRCPRCQADNPPAMRFCGQCAAPLPGACPSCGTENPPSNKFCGQCAAPLGVSTTPRFASPEEYTPGHLAERIINSKAALEGERKQITVLFADLKSSMELLADRDPEDARNILDPVLEHMMEAVHRYEGTVNQVMGDGIMALFGAPLAYEDHAVRACYAALRMQESVRRHADATRRAYGMTVRIRIGLNSGEVVVRSIGSDLHMDYTAVGPTTHLAARMEQLADPGTIVVSKATWQLAEGYIEAKQLGAIPVKGLAEPLEVFEVVGAGAVRSRLRAAAARGLTRFVGREDEFDELLRILKRAASGHGHIVAVVGEPGVGKSRLYWEFIHSHRVHGWLVLESSSVSYGKSTAYLPVVDLLKAYFAIEPSDGARKVREKVTGKILSLDRRLEVILPALLSLLDVPVDDEGWDRLDPPQRRRRILEAVKLLLLRESRVQPVLVLFEDLHWIDSETQALLDSLVESLPTARILLLVNYRPEYVHSWASRTYYRQLSIEPLPAESADDLLGTLLGTDPSLESLKKLLIKRTEGNPLFVEESARALVETNALIGVRGAYRLVHDLRTIEIPTTVQAILAARIDRLQPEDKRLLQAAAVIGEEVSLVALQAVENESSGAWLHAALRRLQAAEFLYEARLFPDLAYTFKHGLTRQVAYQSLPEQRRTALHAKLVKVLAQVYPNRTNELIELLAHHAVCGHQWQEALRYLHQAGTKAADRSVYSQAVVCFEQAIAVSGRLPETGESLEQVFRIRIELRNALLALGEYQRMLNCLREAELLAGRLQDDQKLGRVYSFMTQALFRVGDVEGSLEAGQRGLALAARSGDQGIKVATSLFLGLLHFFMGAYREAVDLLGWTVGYLVGDLAGERFGLAALPSVQSRAYMVQCLAELGRFEEGIARGEEGIRISEAADHPFSMSIACQSLGSLYLIRGDISTAVPLLERALAIASANEIRQMYSPTASRLGLSYVLMGRASDGLMLLQRAVSQEVSALQTSYVARLGQGHIFAGRFHEAAESAQNALEIARRQRERGTEAYLHYILGQAAYGQEAADRAVDRHFRTPFDVANELGMRPLVAHCHVGLGKLYQYTDRRELAREHLMTATALFRELGMTYWMEKLKGTIGDLA